MSLFASPRFLSRVLWADAASCLAVGAMQVLLAGWLAERLHLPAGLLVGSGAALVAYAGLLTWLARQEPLPRGGVWAVIGLNATWAFTCGVLLGTGAIAPNALGIAWVLVQAGVSVVMAELQWTGLRRATRITGWA